MGKTEILAGDIFSQAVRFLAASELLETVIMSLREKDETFGQLFIVCVVNLSLACELFLKSLITNKTGNRPPNTHDLRILFELLDDDLRSEIKAQVAFNISREDFDFDESLDKSNKAFENWRYLYENPVGKEARIDLLKEISKVIERKLLTEHLDWQTPFKETFKT